MSDEQFKGPRIALVEAALVSRLARAMRAKLRFHSRKGHWGSCTRKYLLRRILEEVEELASAMESSASPEMVWTEAADVANLAAMAADNYEESMR